MPTNPFEVTKAVDFTDEQIAANWVDLPGGGFASLADPRSPMPRFLVGGKGGGRTHLLRYFSYALQRLRHKSDLIAGIRSEGYIGIYFRCGGLNSSRFSGKRQDHDTWSAIFSYYTDVWLARLTIDLIADLAAGSPAEFPVRDVGAFTGAVRELFDINVIIPGNDPLRELKQFFHTVQRELDIAINNAALTHRLDIRIGATQGRLAFGVPAAANGNLQALSGLVFAYLFDEYENLTEEQQRYINTLLREKQLPTTFLVGSRLYGLRTHGTLSAGEENRQGSEYDLVVLESAYRLPAHKYHDFCLNIVKKRLEECHIDLARPARLEEYLDRPSGSLEERTNRHVHERTEPGTPRPWLRRLEERLQAYRGGLDSPRLLSLVQFPESPLHEKFAVFMLYRAWADKLDLLEVTTQARAGVERLVAGEKRGRLATTYKHYKQDLYAQLLDDLNLPQEYYGLEEFVRMSGYLPRNLLVVLKQVTRWSLFLAERPFQGGRVSLHAQREGVREASAWFLSDSKGLGRVGDETQLAIKRLAGIFRDMRFSDKPVEVSCSSFATDRRGLSLSAASTLDEAVAHSLLLEVPTGRRERNTRVLQHKYQLNPMLAPLFDLSLALRGAANLSPSELCAIFDPTSSEAMFATMRRKLLARMQSPFVGDDSNGSSLLFEEHGL